MNVQTQRIKNTELLKLYYKQPSLPDIVTESQKHRMMGQIQRIKNTEV